jgi:hypothetical protein
MDPANAPHVEEPHAEENGHHEVDQINILWGFIAVLILDALGLLGLIFVSMKPKNLKRILIELIALSSYVSNENRINFSTQGLICFFLNYFLVGALIGDAFIHIIPEVFGNASESDQIIFSLLILAGFLVSFILERTIGHHHHAR